MMIKKPKKKITSSTNKKRTTTTAAANVTTETNTRTTIIIKVHVTDRGSRALPREKSSRISLPSDGKQTELISPTEKKPPPFPLK